MCGIAGSFHFDEKPASHKILKRMTDAIAHRGPDGEGHFVEGHIGLGHRRLAIIDLTPAGHQPMRSNSGRYVISYNGEVYNFRELRVELEGLGYSFHSNTDTEVVVNAYEEWGEKALNRLNGMYAFAITDLKEQSVLLARDRFGIKPLYYSQSGNQVIFSSEVKGILAHPDFSVEVDSGGIFEYFTFQNFFSGRNLFKNIDLLMPGHFLKLEKGKSYLSPVKFWDFHFREDPALNDFSACREELKRLFEQAVNRQLVSDVELGSYLSGGVDSGSVTMIAANQIPNMNSFTVGFDLSAASGIEFGFDERAFAEQVSYLAKTTQYEMVLKAGDMERIFSRLVYHLEEPRVGQSYPNYYAAMLASKFVKVVLGGTGGDELFGGYPWRYYRAVVNSSFQDYLGKYYQYWQRLLEEGDSEKFFRPIQSSLEGLDPRSLFSNVFSGLDYEEVGPEGYVNRSLYFESKTFLHSLLVVEDKLSMAHGLESRVPFLDNDLVDFAQRIPVKFKLGKLNEFLRIDENDPENKRQKYFEKTRDGKLILRDVMEDYLPSDRARAVKQGFSAPDASWFRGESIDYVKDRIFSRSAKSYDFIDRETTHRLVQQHLDGKVNRRLLIWSLLYFEEWCWQFL